MAEFAARVSESKAWRVTSSPTRAHLCNAEQGIKQKPALPKIVNSRFQTLDTSYYTISTARVGSTGVDKVWSVKQDRNGTYTRLVILCIP